MTSSADGYSQCDTKAWDGRVSDENNDRFLKALFLEKALGRKAQESMPRLLRQPSRPHHSV